MQADIDACERRASIEPTPVEPDSSKRDNDPVIGGTTDEGEP